MTKRFQPPDVGCRPSGIGRAAELAGPLSQTLRSPQPDPRECPAHLVDDLEAELVAVEGDRPTNVGDHVADGGRHQRYAP